MTAPSAAHLASHASDALSIPCAVATDLCKDRLNSLVERLIRRSSEVGVREALLRRRAAVTDAGRPHVLQAPPMVLATGSSGVGTRPREPPMGMAEWSDAGARPREPPVGMAVRSDAVVEGGNGRMGRRSALEGRLARAASVGPVRGRDTQGVSNSQYRRTTVSLSCEGRSAIRGRLLRL